MAKTLEYLCVTLCTVDLVDMVGWRQMPVLQDHAGCDLRYKWKEGEAPWMDPRRDTIA